MRLLFPETRDVDPASLYHLAPQANPGGRPQVVVNMITTVDGAVAVDGRSGGLGGDGDRTVFQALRAAADVVLVGAGTVRAERYRTPSRPGLQVAVVSARVDLDWTWPLFTEGQALVVTTTEAASRVPAGVPAVVAGTGHVDLASALDELGRRGARVVLCEGGPHLNGQLFAAGLVDEVCLTVAPWLAAGTSTRMAQADAAVLTRLRPRHVAADDEGYLFLRYALAEGS